MIVHGNVKFAPIALPIAYQLRPRAPRAKQMEPPKLVPRTKSAPKRRGHAGALCHVIETSQKNRLISTV
jgi:hypothetical protein